MEPIEYKRRLPGGRYLSAPVTLASQLKKQAGAAHEPRSPSWNSHDPQRREVGRQWAKAVGVSKLVAGDFSAKKSKPPSTPLSPHSGERSRLRGLGGAVMAAARYGGSGPSVANPMARHRRVNDVVAVT